MLNRRYLRIKVLQFLYSYYQGNHLDAPVREKNLFTSLDKVYQLYLKMLWLYMEFFRTEEGRLERAKNKRFATDEEKRPNRHFVENKAYLKLKGNKGLLKAIDKHKIDWSLEERHVKNLLDRIRDSNLYKKYMEKESGSFKDDQQFAVVLYQSFLMDNETFEYILEEEDMNWASDIDLVNVSVIKTLQHLRGSFTEDSEILLPLFKDKKEDADFIRDLLILTVENDDKYEEIIEKKTQNWEMDRIARIDIILLKMALCELLNQPSIPIKVTINEYIELSKYFSTKKSKSFINGILDNMIADLKENNEIKKTGRGLIG